MGRRIQTAALVALWLVVGATAAGAQRRALSLSVNGGGYSALRKLDNAGTTEFKTGFSFGGSLGVQVDKYIELAVGLTGAQSHVLKDGAETDVYLNRYYLSADLKAQYPAASGVRPYGLFGLGAVRLHEKGTTGADKTQGFAHLGAGIAYAIRRNFAIFIQGDGFAYSLNGLTSATLGSYSTAQLDVGWTGGLTYVLPF